MISYGRVKGKTENSLLIYLQVEVRHKFCHSVGFRLVEQTDDQVIVFEVNY